jgi:hypothetical protein
MTFAEFEHLLAVEVSKRYHRDPHRGITGADYLGRAAELAIQDGSELINSAVLDRVTERLRILAS